ncbi:MAG TPA: aminotransferase class V-fold PLP-dependent enzyme [Terriglobales bacterium]|nr:aminotransferase class V-fold PLP-dependent enzyme [Terriglobales bacterium]
MNRRHFLTGTGMAGAALFTHPLLERLAAVPRSLPPDSLYASDPEAYWAGIRRQFLIPADEVYFNNGTCGSSPAPVLKAIFDGYNTTEQMADAHPEDYPIWGYGPWNEFRDPMAAFIGCTRDELALVRNATEANNYIANGFDMKPGEEVLMTDQEHEGGENPWLLKAKRYGIVVKKVTVPKPLTTPDDVLNRFNDAITPRTRMIFFSHITTITGVVLPAKQLCALARSKGIPSAVDGAHVTGMMKLDVHDIGCDFYTSSPHKWLQAPKGSGYLYVRAGMEDRLWNTIVSSSWDDPKGGAYRFQQIGTSNVPALWGLRASIEFANQIGMDKIEARHRAQNQYILEAMEQRGGKNVTGLDPGLRCGIVSVDVPPVQRMALENWMWTTHKIRIRGGEPSRLRLSTPYYLLRADMDRFLAAFDEYRKNMPAA